MFLQQKYIANFFFSKCIYDHFFCTFSGKMKKTGKMYNSDIAIVCMKA